MHEGDKMMNYNFFLMYYFFGILLVFGIYFLATFIRKFRDPILRKSRYVALAAALIAFCDDIVMLVAGKLYNPSFIYSMSYYNIQKQSNLVYLITISFLVELIPIIVLLLYFNIKEKQNMPKYKN